MAPEVILAMDSGQYDNKADIWSLGITCYEFGEKRPPLFHLNAMSALYHISQSDPPQLMNTKWSEEYRDFTNIMLKKEPETRPTASELLTHNFMKLSDMESVFTDLLKQCSMQAKKKNETAVNKYLKLLGVTGVSGSESACNSSDSDLSRQNTLTDQLNQISISSKGGSVSRHSPEKMMGTIKTQETIKEESTKWQNTGHRLKDYQLLRQANMKKITILDQKLAAELGTIKKAQIKAMDLMKAVNAKAVKGLNDKYEAEIDRIKRAFRVELKKIVKNGIEDAIERRNVLNALTNIDNIALKYRLFAPISISSSPSCTIGPAESDEFFHGSAVSPNRNYEEIDKLVLSYATKIMDFYKNMIVEKNKLVVSQRENLGHAELSDNNALVQKELGKIEKIFQRKEQLLRRLHEYESNAQAEHVKNKIMLLKREHLNSRKNRPKDFKVIEAKFSKDYKRDIKNITEVYRVKIKNISDAYPRELHPKMRNQFENEKIAEILSKKSEMEAQILQYQEETMKVEDFQNSELIELEDILKSETNSLENYQKSQLSHLAKTKMNELQCVHKKYEELESQIKKNVANDIRTLNEAVELDLEEINAPFQFSFEMFMAKNMSQPPNIAKNTSHIQLSNLDNQYASLNLPSRSRRKFLPEF